MPRRILPRLRGSSRGRVGPGQFVNPRVINAFRNLDGGGGGGSFGDPPVPTFNYGFRMLDADGSPTVLLDMNDASGAFTFLDAAGAPIEFTPTTGPPGTFDTFLDAAGDPIVFAYEVL